ncbi:unnamed protein product [Allacma fusca]|uniref:CRAL-TRIO domain-containing protein n=1 Tax=Allacma fusca TaxID=39272 RepID=A0A8J2LPG8_9HEXA|nr:unnamed protein product [Allacma fusca]
MAIVNIVLIFVCSLHITSAIIQNTTTIAKNGNVTAARNRLYKNEVYTTAHGILTKSEVFRNFSLSETENWMDEISKWKAPKKLEAFFRYYLAGYTDDNLPLWIAEVGNVSVRQVVEEGERSMDLLEKYGQKVLLNVFRSLFRNGSPEMSEIVAIFDFGGFRMSEVTHLPTITYMMKIMKRYVNVVDACLQQALLINATFAVQVLIDRSRPFLGHLLEKVDIYGANKNKWIPVLRRKFSDDLIPPWYGGAKNFKPVSVFGLNAGF